MIFDQARIMGVENEKIVRVLVNGDKHNNFTFDAATKVTIVFLLLLRTKHTHKLVKRLLLRQEKVENIYEIYQRFVYVLSVYIFYVCLRCIRIFCIWFCFLYFIFDMRKYKYSVAISFENHLRCVY